jgi:hypothetical protein
MQARSNKNRGRFEAGAKNDTSTTGFYPHCDESEGTKSAVFQQAANASWEKTGRRVSRIIISRMRQAEFLDT